MSRALSVPFPGGCSSALALRGGAARANPFEGHLAESLRSGVEFAQNFVGLNPPLVDVGSKMAEINPNLIGLSAALAEPDQYLVEGRPDLAKLGPNLFRCNLDYVELGSGQIGSKPPGLLAQVNPEFSRPSVSQRWSKSTQGRWTSTRSRLTSAQVRPKRNMSESSRRGRARPILCELSPQSWSDAPNAGRFGPP